MAGEIIRPKDLTPRPAPVASELMVVDNSVNVGAATIKSIVEVGRPAASQAEAQAGTDAVKTMTPLTTKQSIAAEVGVSLASKAQGDKADSAVQPDDLAAVATSGEYGDLAGKPVIPPGLADGDKGDISVSGSGTVWTVMNKPMPTVAAAIADKPAVDPAYYDIAYFDTAYQTGSGAKWKKVSSNPGLPAGAAFQNANGAWYVIDAGTLRPEQFGRIGVNAAGDTAAWVAMASVANIRAKAYIVADSLYMIAGSTVLFSGGVLKRLTLRLLNAEFYQQSNLSKTLRFEGITDVRVRGGHGVGRGGGSGEYNGVSSSYNGVAFMYFFNCEKVRVAGASEYNHAGGGFVVQGGRIRDFENITCEGIGYPYIDPIGQGNQGNGSDFGIMCQPTVNNETQLFKFEDRFVNCRIFNHAFGIQTVATKSLIIHGCDIGPCPGQHGVYAIECDGLSIQGNNFRACRQFCFKQQYENYAGKYIGPLWQPTTSYAVGTQVRSFGALYVCKTAHTSGATWSATNWDIDPIYFRNGGVVSNNFFDGADHPQSQGLGWISTDESANRYIFSKNLIISGNTLTRFDSDPIKLDRCLDTDILNNMISGGRFGMFLTDYRGRVKGNAFRSTRQTACYISASGEVWYEDNLHIDCGLLGSGVDNQTPSLVTFSRTATTIPGMPAVNFINYNRNEIRYSQAVGPAPNLFFGADTNTTWRVTETRCNTGTSKKGRVDGTVADQFRNDFATWNNAAQNESVPTDAATLITNLRAKRVIK